MLNFEENIVKKTARNQNISAIALFKFQDYFVQKNQTSCIMEVARPEYTLRQLTFCFLKPGYSGFGGPVALVGYMHRDLVENFISF